MALCSSPRCQMLSPLWNYEADRVLSWMNSTLCAGKQSPSAQPYDLRPAFVRSLTPTRRTHRPQPLTASARLPQEYSAVSETIIFVRSSQRVLDMKVLIARPLRDTVCKVYMISDIRTRPCQLGCSAMGPSRIASEAQVALAGQRFAFRGPVY